MNDFIEKNRGPLIAFFGAGGGLVVLVIISAIVNMPSDINLGQIVVNLIWVIFLGGLLVAGFLYARERFDGEVFLTEEDTLLEEEVPAERPLGGDPGAEAAPHHRPLLTETLEKIAPRIPLGEKLKALFGTTNMVQITKGVEAMYGELEELRVKGGPTQATNQEMITKLTSEIEKAQTVSARWEAKAISSTQEVAKLRQELREHGKWRPLSEEQLTVFLPTVTIKDGVSEKAFIESKRRRRRLMQRMNAEGYSIVCRAE